MSTSKDIENLISQVALGNRDAFKSLYHATSAKLFGVCLRVLNDRASAEDALQEIYVKIWQKSKSFAANNYSPMSWLVVVARNHCIDIIRARKPQSVDIDDAIDISDETTKTPEQEAINTSEGRRIDVCLGELDADKAKAVQSAYVEGFSYQELAEQYDVPINTMRTWLRRSLAKLKECLER